MIKSSLICKEEVLREKIYLTRKSSSLDPSWLADVYSSSLAEDLRYSISERLGWLGEKGWQHLKRLIDQEGIQPEFIYASGLCYQTEAKDWLFSQLNGKSKFQVETLQALSCWGGDFSIQLLKNILSEKSQADLGWNIEEIFLPTTVDKLQQLQAEVDTQLALKKKFVENHTGIEPEIQQLFPIPAAPFTEDAVLQHQQDIQSHIEQLAKQRKQRMFMIVVTLLILVLGIIFILS